MQKAKRLVSFILCVMTLVLSSFTACSKADIKNVIYVIGDGMGFNHIENARMYSGAESFAFEKYFVGEVSTNSASSEVTDSAASATALATGVKTNNDYVGVDTNKTPLENVMEISQKVNKKTGIVTTDVLSGATPGGFSAHVGHRNNEEEIILDQMECNINILMGKFSGAYDAMSEDFQERGIQYAKTLEDLNELSTNKRIIANVENVNPVRVEGSADDVPLKALVEYALDYLSKDNENGFTLMIEGAYIDKYSHNADIMGMIYALLDLNDAIEYVLEWAKDRNDTAIIITADHETGGLLKAESKDMLSSGFLYCASGHTSRNVPLYLYNVKTDKTSFDNTDIFDLAKSLIVG